MQPYHDKGRGNGYVLNYGGKNFYFAGDTEGVPEMRALKNIDVAFIPMNLPYTMTPAEAADAVKAFHPKVAIPYHYKGQDVEIFKKALEGTGIEVQAAGVVSQSNATSCHGRAVVTLIFAALRTATGHPCSRHARR